MTFTKEQLTRIIESADEVITALAGTNDDIHPDNSTKMCAAWDDLNDRNAPPSVVKKLAEMALAGMEVEAVGVTYKSEIECLKRGEMANVMPPDYKGCDSGDSVYLYDAPQPLTTSERAELENYRNAQQVVPEALAVDVDADDHPLTWSYHNGWNACRAAMLQGKAETVIQPSTLRDGVEALRTSGIAIDSGKIHAERAALNEPVCWCRTCRPVSAFNVLFIVCPECGNKRCPHANDHRNVCTGSNEPGQEGSAYPAAPQQEA